MLLAVGIDFVHLPTTPLQLLVVTLGLTLVLVLLIGGVGQVLSPIVDRRWPATEPLDPTELLWAEMGGYVQSHFRGLDLDRARDVAAEMKPVKIPGGTNIVEQGEPAAYFYVLREGEAEVVQRVRDTEQKIRTYGPGESFGEVAILRRSSRTASVRAVTDCTVLQLPAEDFLAATALSAAEENVLLEAVDRYLAEDRARQGLTGGGRRRRGPGHTGPRAGGVAPSTSSTPSISSDSSDSSVTSTPSAAAAAPSPEAEPAPAPSPEPEASTPPATAVPPAAAAPSSRTRRFPVTHVIAGRGAELRSGPAPDAPVVSDIDGGVGVRVLERFDGRAHVQSADGRQGWIGEDGILPA